MSNEVPRWEARYSPDVGWYVRVGHEVYPTWYEQIESSARELAAYLNNLDAKAALMDEAVKHWRSDGSCECVLKHGDNAGSMNEESLLVRYDAIPLPPEPTKEETR